MIETLAVIECDGAKPFTAGIVLHDDRVVEATDIVGYMRRGEWTRDRVRDYCRSKGWRVSVVYEVKR